MARPLARQETRKAHLLALGARPGFLVQVERDVEGGIRPRSDRWLRRDLAA